MKIVKHLFYFYLFLNSILGFSQEDRFYHYGLDEGLSQESVQRILKDSQGFLWLGTQDGLNRFDGNKFTIYKNEEDNEQSISGNFITSLVEAEHKIWIGTSNNGVNCYDKSKNKMERIGLLNSNCTALAKDNLGTIYVGYLSNGLSIFTKENKQILETKVPFFTENQLRITAINIHDEVIYVGTKSGRLFKALLNENKLHFDEVIFSKNLYAINKIFIDKNIIWLGTVQGLYAYQTANKILNEIKIEKFNTNLTKKLIIYQIAKKEQYFYVATDNGLFTLSNLNLEKNNFSNCTIYKGDKNNENSITSNRVYDFLFDDNILWIGTNKLDALPLKKPVFKAINTFSKNPLNNNHIYAILKTNDYLFIGTRNGLNCIDSNGKVSIINKENTNNKLAYNVIRGISKDNNNNLWLATTKGVSILDLNNFNPNKPKIKSFFYNANRPQSLSDNNTRQVFIDTKNQIWITTYGGGLNRFIGNVKANDFRFQHFTHQNNSNSLSSDFIFNINQDKDNQYWITTINGFSKLYFIKDDYNAPNFITYHKDITDLKMLQTSSTYSTLFDKNQQLWLGTDKGLYRFDTKNKNFIHYGKKNGLTNSVVYSILDDDNLLWLSTNAGLFSFNKTDKLFENYTIKDGLLSAEFNLGAQFKDIDNNEFYFGGVNGVNYFNPKDLNKLYKEGNLLFTSLRIKGKEINPNKTNNILEKSITKATTINLKHTDFPCYLAFSDLNFDIPKNSQFVYKLTPNDREWNALNNRKEIQLLNLPAGTYTVEVQGVTRGQMWQKKPLQIQLQIIPAWYKSNLAYFIYSLFLIGLVFYLTRYVLQRNFEQQEVVRLKELNDLKTTLYTNITHEFRTPITVILGMTQSLKEKFSKNKLQTNRQIELIERNSNNLLNLVSQILDLSKLEKGKLELDLKQDNIVNYLKYLTESYASYAEEKQVNLIFYNEENEILMDYDANKISQIITNLISNAIKFCNENDKIIVHLSKNDTNQLVIKVSDTGIGISEENLPFIFDRFYQVENSNARKYDGTGIGLALTKELALLMQGEITVKSKENQGTIITVKLPITTNEILRITKQTYPIEQVFFYKEKTPIIDNENTELPIALVVEDNDDVAIYIRMCLEGKYQVLYAKDGAIGITMAKEHIPDIIISDVMMPKKNGFELCETLKQDPITNHIPIILLTAKAAQEDKISGLILGADAYLTKPFHKEELMIRMDKLIALRKTLQNKYKDIASLVTKPTEKVEVSDINTAFIQKVIAIINRNLDNDNFQAVQLAKELHISESQLYRKLKAVTNLSIAVFVRKVRLEKAKELLLTTKMTASQVAYATGFNNPSWFSKVYKEMFGHSPSDKR